MLGVSERTLRRYLRASRIREGDRILAADLEVGRTGLRAPSGLRSALLHERLERLTAMLTVVVEVIDQQRTRLRRDDMQWLVEQARDLTSPARWLLLAVRLRPDDLSYLRSPDDRMRQWIDIVRCAQALRSYAAQMGRDGETLASIVHAIVLHAATRASMLCTGRRQIQQTIERAGAGANRQLVRRERKRRAEAAIARRR